MTDPNLVNVDNFARAESDRMFAAILRDTGGVNQWIHNRAPTPIDHEPDGTWAVPSVEPISE